MNSEVAAAWVYETLVTLLPAALIRDAMLRLRRFYLYEISPQRHGRRCIFGGHPGQRRLHSVLVVHRFRKPACGDYGHAVEHNENSESLWNTDHCRHKLFHRGCQGLRRPRLAGILRRRHPVDGQPCRGPELERISVERRVGL